MAGAPVPPPVPGSPTTEAERPGRQAVPWGLAEAVAVFFVSLVLTIVAGEILRVTLTGVLAADVLDALYGPLTLVVLGLTTLAWVAARHRGAVGMLTGWRPGRRDVLVGIAGGVAAVVVVTVGLGLLLGLLLEAAGREIPPVQEGLREAARDPRTAPLFLFSALVVAPAFEELFFRGMVFPAIAKRVGVWGGIVASAALFGFVHLNQAEDLLGAVLLLLRLVPLGIFFAWLFHWRGTIVAPILAHSVFNAASVALLFAGVE